jgi:hypothetical protein
MVHNNNEELGSFLIHGTSYTLKTTKIRKENPMTNELSFPFKGKGKSRGE